MINIQTIDNGFLQILKTTITLSTEGIDLLISEPIDATK